MKDIPNILIVDDEYINAELLSKILSSQGHKPTICTLIAEVLYYF